MHTEVVTVPEDMDQEAVSKLFAEHNFLAMPVVDAERRVKGIVTVDDIVDVVQEEATEDIQKLGGMSALEAPYLSVGFGDMLRKRAGWLSALFIGEMFTASAMGYFEDEIARAVVLALFVPLIISSGGNSGSQASTLVVRALALGRGHAARLVAGGTARAGHRPDRSGSCWPRSASCASSPGSRSSISTASTTCWSRRPCPCSLIGVVMFGTLAGSDAAAAAAPARLRPRQCVGAVRGDAGRRDGHCDLLLRGEHPPARHLVVTTRPTAPSVVVDTRPLSRILLERTVRPAILVGTALLYWFIVTRQPPAGLTEAGLKTLGIFVVCLVLWVTSVLPLMVTSLLAIIMLPLAGIMPASKAFALFGNEAVFFILGVFILAACLMKSRLSTRLALGMLRRFGKTPRTLLLSIYLLNAIMSFFMSEHAVAAMNFPIIVEIVDVLRLQKLRSHYAKALFLSMAWGTTIGGVATLLGGARAPLALGMVKEATGQTFTFAEWALASLPVTLGMLLVGWIVITRFFPIDVTSIRAADALLDEKALALGRMSVREKAIARGDGGDAGGLDPGRRGVRARQRRHRRRRRPLRPESGEVGGRRGLRELGHPAHVRRRHRARLGDQQLGGGRLAVAEHHLPVVAQRSRRHRDHLRTVDRADGADEQLGRGRDADAGDAGRGPRLRDGPARDGAGGRGAGGARLHDADRHAGERDRLLVRPPLRCAT